MFAALYRVLEKEDPAVEERKSAGLKSEDLGGNPSSLTGSEISGRSSCLPGTVRRKWDKNLDLKGYENKGCRSKQVRD